MNHTIIMVGIYVSSLNFDNIIDPNTFGDITLHLCLHSHQHTGMLIKLLLFNLVNS